MGDAWKTFRPIRCENWGINVSVRAKLGEGLGSYPGLRPGSGPSGVLDRVGVQKRGNQSCGAGGEVGCGHQEPERKNNNSWAIQTLSSQRLVSRPFQWISF